MKETNWGKDYWIPKYTRTSLSRPNDWRIFTIKEKMNWLRENLKELKIMREYERNRYLNPRKYDELEINHFKKPKYYGEGWGESTISYLTGGLLN